MEIWRTGDFTFHFAADSAGCEFDKQEKSLSEQDVLIEYFVVRHPDSYHELNRCYNYRGSLLDVELCGRSGRFDPGVKVVHIANLSTQAERRCDMSEPCSVQRIAEQSLAKPPFKSTYSSFLHPRVAQGTTSPPCPET
eukprot:1004109-Prorocentrum_minimum.AAC.1